ncbi:MAG TPA: DMT family transporter [Ktedonobacterales bacterium]|nr:DMT family transporter [Ktedonobacterales bacterium]
MSMQSPSSRPADPRIGYFYAGLNAVISGFAIYINSLGVSLFKDSTLYTTLKNAVVGVALLLPLVFLASRRAEWKRLTGRQWVYLLLLAVVGGSVPYALFFRGLQLSTPVASSLLNHAQFLLVAVLALFFLRERHSVLVWLALATLLVGTVWGVNVTHAKWSLGDTLVALSTVLFAAGVVLAKYLLRELSTLTVMTAKMSIGSLFLLIYVAATGRLGAIGTLSGRQWSFVVVTGLILLAFTVTAFLALRFASATVATAIPAASPLITTALVVLVPQQGLKPSPVFGLALMAVALAVLFVIGLRQESRSRVQQEHGEVVVA